MFPTTIIRCHHLKTNGTQCGSPALRGKRFCYFHSRHQLKPAKDSAFDFPTLEDANAIQLALMQVMRAVADNKIEIKRGALLLYALQTASFNLKRVRFEPHWPRVVRDRGLARFSVPRTTAQRAFRPRSRTRR